MCAVYMGKEIPNPLATTRFVGLEETRTALEMLAATNCPHIHADGGLMPATLVRYTRNAVPLRITGSFPIRTPRPQKNAYSVRKRIWPWEPALRQTWNAKNRNRPVASRLIAMYARLMKKRRTSYGSMSSSPRIPSLICSPPIVLVVSKNRIPIKGVQTWSKTI